MRDFKFRAFEKDSQEMFYPDTTNNNGYFFSGFMDGVLKVATSPYSDDKDYILMQYTGLKDKNCKEIYEGDILKDDYGLGEVKWIQEHCSFVVYSRNPSQYNFLESDGQLKYSEVIGNVFDMPDWDC